MKLVFRYDDFASAPGVPAAVDEAVIGAFASRELPVVIAVTPFKVGHVSRVAPQPMFPIEDDSQRVALLRRAVDRGSQIGLHGYNHARSPGRAATEFAGQPRLVQWEKIKGGKEALNRCLPGVPVEIFVPPFNSHDANTASCLAEQGFRVLCGGYNAGFKDSAPLQFVSSFLETGDFLEYMHQYSLDDLDRAVGEAVLVITMHPFEFMDKAHPKYCPLPDFERALDELKRRAMVTVLSTDRPVPLPQPWQVSHIKTTLLFSRWRRGAFAQKACRLAGLNCQIEKKHPSKWVLNAGTLLVHAALRIRRHLRRQGHSA